MRVDRVTMYPSFLFCTVLGKQVGWRDGAQRKQHSPWYAAVAVAAITHLLAGSMERKF